MITITALMLVAFSATSPVYDSELIFPTDPKHNHGSSIVELKNGDLLACWFHGSGERSSDDVMIQGARKHKGASKWSQPFEMADSSNLPDCNPVLYVDPRGTLWLFWIAVQDNQWGGSLLKYRTSTHYKKAGPPRWDWQDVIHCRPRNLDTLVPAYLDKMAEQYKEEIAKDKDLPKEIQEIKVLVKNKLASRLGWMTRLHPIMLPNNRMMLGLYSDVFECSLAAFTDDWGKNWTFSDPILGLANIQPAFVQKKSGDLVAMMRDNGFENRIRLSDSKDGGMTWTEARNMDIPNPGSSVDCIPLKSGAWVLVCNDTEEGRHKVTAYLSDDEGATWKWKRSLEDFEKEKGSGAYPCVIQSKNGLIHCSYSYVNAAEKGSTIKHVRFNEAWIQEGK